MRQGETAPTGSWIGKPQGGVDAPDPLILPDPTTRFAATATRLEALSGDHPMADWLRFMVSLAQAQHDAMAALAPLAGPDAALVRQAVEARMPPLAADGHRRHPIWREGLLALLGHSESGPFAAAVPREARAVMQSLRARGAAAAEKLADDFLSGGVAAADSGAALYVAAALQVYFTRLAGGLSAQDLRLLPERGLCPCCGSLPVSGMVTASGKTPGARYLHCSLCSTAWNHVRASCITCGESRELFLLSIEGGSGAVRAEVCGDCRSYAKMLYQAQDTRVDPVADDLATLGLDVLAAEAGWSRHAPNPLVLTG
ncbi:formate dehydrogenase accessory protein FdhE [Phenylobacterium sp.]|uniref:formate dehydrogenase accessory protein FdhE n=1 Tax=Phenylobacterium sp. TaxID=1871053 RepID=UPI00122BA9CF|nr:formate dehydrogenase accessory protein FdhE [Phenylobacterium sp.]THD63448.1 MAG: formate dehydrogenase accessory protein FdhE [Phenylobacterium sp.]